MAESSTLVSGEALAKLFHLTIRRVQQLAKDGVIPRAERNKYDLVGAVQGYVKFLQDRAFGKEVGTVDLHEHKARLTKAQADHAEMEVNVKRGALVSVHAARDQLEAVVLAFRSKVLAIPTKAAPLVHGCGSIAQTKQQLEIALHEALNELANLDVAKLGVVEGRENGLATSEADG